MPYVSVTRRRARIACDPAGSHAVESEALDADNAHADMSLSRPPKPSIGRWGGTREIRGGLSVRASAVVGGTFGEGGEIVRTVASWLPMQSHRTCGFLQTRIERAIHQGSSRKPRSEGRGLVLKARDRSSRSIHQAIAPVEHPPQERL